MRLGVTRPWRELRAWNLNEFELLKGNVAPLLSVAVPFAFSVTWRYRVPLPRDVVRIFIRTVPCPERESAQSTGHCSTVNVQSDTRRP